MNKMLTTPDSVTQFIKVIEKNFKIFLPEFHRSGRVLTLLGVTIGTAFIFVDVQFSRHILTGDTYRGQGYC